ncbi:hypothetical protein GCM10010923_07510 [Blastomonas marina]|uniref:Uncharacterized protein n=1 Tax=Blastomonas marina TaxID=1867408 RepID=A0ABQ1F6B4_9SPHN|nr:hypothetical protein GCM10010923_07510 [Blastomonas marina]
MGPVLRRNEAPYAEPHTPQSASTTCYDHEKAERYREAQHRLNVVEDRGTAGPGGQVQIAQSVDVVEYEQASQSQDDQTLGKPKLPLSCSRKDVHDL